MIEQGGSVVYDSHLETPAADITLAPFQNSSIDHNFDYFWNIPTDAAQGEYSYRFCVYDTTRMLTYFCSSSSMLLELSESPVSVRISPSAIILLGAGQQQIDFIIVNNGPTGGDTYLSVSLSPNLRIAELIPSSTWDYYGVGVSINCKPMMGEDCSMNSIYKLYEVHVDLLPTGSHTFSLIVSSKPGAGEDEWLRYRLAVHLSPNTIIPGEWYARWPFSGDPDQQGWYAAFLPVTVQRSDVFLPTISR